MIRIEAGYAGTAKYWNAGNVVPMYAGEYISVPSAEIYATDSGGDLPLMVLVHGLGASHTSWVEIRDAMTRSFRVVTLDLPGHGYSPPADHHEIGLFAGVVAELIERVGGPATLVGNSMGGLVAEVTASRRPDLVSHLVLISPASPPDWGARPQHLRVATRLLVQSTPVAGHAMALAYRRSRTAETQAMELLETVAADADALPDRVVASALQMSRLRRSMPWSIRAVVESAASIRATVIRRQRFIDMIGAIEVPALVLHGDRDVVVPTSSIQHLVSLREDWVHVSRQDLGHVPQLEDASWVSEQIAAWTASADEEARAT